MANRICVANNKGGVAKSTTSINLAAGLAQRGRKVLLLDMDPSAGASVFFGLAVAVREEREQIYSITDLLLGKPFAPQRNHLLADLDLLPATKRLAYLAGDLSKKDLGAAEGGVRLLAEPLVRVETEYDYVIIDTQPTLNRLLIMALLAAPNIIAPVQADIGNVPMTMDFHDSIRGLQRLTQRIRASRTLPRRRGRGRTTSSGASPSRRRLTSSNGPSRRASACRSWMATTSPLSARSGKGRGRHGGRWRSPSWSSASSRT